MLAAMKHLLKAGSYNTLFGVSAMTVPLQGEARESMRDGFIVDEKFREYSVDDLCVTQLRVAMKVGENKD